MDERVVVVDDDAIILKQANMILTEAGFNVTCLKNGKLSKPRTLLSDF